MLLNPLTIHTPKSISEAAKLYSDLEHVKLQAGGTFLLNSLKLLKRKGVKTPEHVISLKKIQDLRGIEVSGETLTIKSMTTITELAASPLLTDNWAVLKTVCKNISTNPIRNMATVGGNLTCRYTWTEMPAAMTVLEADLHFITSLGEEKIIPVEEFYKTAAKTDSILTAISIKKEPHSNIAYRRIKKSQFVDIPLLSLGIKTTFKENQFSNTLVSVNNCVEFAQRDHTLEDYLNNSSCENNLAEKALEHIDNKIYDTRSSDYKKYMFRTCLKSAINELTEKRAK